MPVYFFFTGEHPEYHTPKDRPETINCRHRQGRRHGRSTGDDHRDDKDRPEYVAGAGGSTGGRPGGPKLGLMPRYDGGGDGMEISGIMPGGAAEAAGLKKGRQDHGDRRQAGQERSGLHGRDVGPEDAARKWKSPSTAMGKLKVEGHPQVSLSCLRFSDLT